MRAFRHRRGRKFYDNVTGAAGERRLITSSTAECDLFALGAI
jgi:hypothetical protein